MLTLQEFYTWNWILQQRQKAEAGDKRAFRATEAEEIEAFAKRKGLNADGDERSDHR